jgi:hypothetical protein
MTLFYNKPWPFLYEGDWWHDQDEEEDYMICENHDCGESVTMRYPVYRGRECRLLCYECYLRWLKEEEDAEIPMSEDR